MPSGQQGCPGRPQLPLRQPPPTQAPAVPPQLPPSATQTSLTQQPPAPQACPAQQGSPGRPHGRQKSLNTPPPGFRTHASPLAVQYSCVPSRQQRIPSAPQVSPAPGTSQKPVVQASPISQSIPSAMHVPKTQQSPVAQLAVGSAQQGWPAPPQALIAPAEHTIPDIPVGSWPLAMQLAPSQQAPPEQVPPAPPQHGVPGTPHTSQAPDAPQVPTLQVWPTATHRSGPGPTSQQPVLQVSPAQQG